MPTAFSTHIHQDGSKKAYEIFGTQHLGKRIPLVLIIGMALLRGDWQRLVGALSQYRPVLTFDHRGMGDSTLSTRGDENITLELMARDVLDLIVAIGWKEVAICGYSLGGVITQELLFLPFHSANPTPLPFRITHVFLAATLCEPYQNKAFAMRLQNLTPLPAIGERTFKESRELIRPMATELFDFTWISKNPNRFNWWLDQMARPGRPTRTVFMQARAISKINFGNLHATIPKDIKILVFHGKLDKTLSYSCSRVLLTRLPRAKDVEIGTQPGQLPSLDFAHQWFEYFDIAVWKDVFEVFLDDRPNRLSTMARL